MEKICEEIWKTWVRKKSMGKTFKKRRWVKKIKKTSDQNSHIGLLVVLLNHFNFLLNLCLFSITAIKSLVFLRRYIKFRGLSQETYYNVARVLHQLSLFDLAADFYNKCLDTPCFFPDQEEVYSLKRFAAYNLVQIYKHSGSYTLARQIVRKHLTI